jgi:hypothetical protein
MLVTSAEVPGAPVKVQLTSMVAVMFPPVPEAPGGPRIGAIGAIQPAENKMKKSNNITINFNFMNDYRRYDYIKLLIKQTYNGITMFKKSHLAHHNKYGMSMLPKSYYSQKSN